MDEVDKRLLAALLARQREVGAAAEIPPDRLRASVQGEAPLDQREVTALLASPLAREEYALHLRLARLRQAASVQSDKAAYDDHRVFRLPEEARLAAASDDLEEAFRVECKDAELSVIPGRTPATRFLLTLRLFPQMEGGVSGRAFEIREDGPDGLLWMTGRTDEHGVAHQLWVHVGTTPHERRDAASLQIVLLD